MSKSKKFSTEHETDQDSRELGVRKKFTTKDLISLSPKNKNQKDFIESYYTNFPIIVQDGPAGTGKTFLAMYMALTEVFDSSTPYDKLIVIRTAVETRSQGFLPGDQDEKNDPFERPYKDIVSNIVKYNKAYDNMKALNVYEFMTTSHLRGTTFDNAIIILDEAQNGDISELSTVITRLGINSRIVVVGDSKQDDLFRKRQESGFEELKYIFGKMSSDSVATITYTVDDIVRSGIVREFLKASYRN